MTFNMELYKTDLFLAPTQGLFSIAENGPIYVEVTTEKHFETNRRVLQDCVAEPNPFLSVERFCWAVGSGHCGACREQKIWDKK